jgi:hypothetical protein
MWWWPAAALCALEQWVCRFAAELGYVLTEQLGESRRAGHLPTLTICTVLESSAVATGSIVSPLAADVGPCCTEMEFSPLLNWHSLTLAALVVGHIGQHYIPALQADHLLWTQAAVVEDTEEGHQTWAARLLCPHCFQKRPGLVGVYDDASVDFPGCLGRPPLQMLDRVLIEQLQLDGVVESVEQDGAVPTHRRWSHSSAIEPGGGCRENLTAQRRIRKVGDFPGVVLEPPKDVGGVFGCRLTLFRVAAPIHQGAAQYPMSGKMPSMWASCRRPLRVLVFRYGETW